MYYLDELNEQQRAAVEHVLEPTVVIAGAGTGKTKLMATKVLHYLEMGFAAENILAISFTNKAARELRHRIWRLTEERDMWCTTFHGFAYNLLKKYGWSLGYVSHDFQVIDDLEQKKILSKILSDDKFLNKYKREHNNQEFKIKVKLGELVGIVSDYKVNRVLNNDLKIDESLHVLTEEYNDRLEKNRVIDYDDLLIKLVQMFINEPIVLQVWQKHLKCILVDEYQDTNELQNFLVIMLSELHGNITIVGDPDQSIYKFRGAMPDIMEKFTKSMRAKVFVLERNYRCTKTILDAANSLIESNYVPYEYIEDYSHHWEVESKDYKDEWDEMLKTFFTSNDPRANLQTAKAISQFKGLSKTVQNLIDKYIEQFEFEYVF